MKEYNKTPNLHLAAYLISEGIKLIETELKEDHQRADFILEDSPQLPILISKFYQGEGKVDPRGYSFIIKELKARIQLEKLKYEEEHHSTGSPD